MSDQPVKCSVTLPRPEYAQLRRECDQLAARLGLARVHGSAVFRALLAELRTDPALADRVAATVAAGAVRHAA